MNIKKSVLKALLRGPSAVAPTRSTMPILTHVRLCTESGMLRCGATDLVSTAVSEVAFDGDLNIVVSSTELGRALAGIGSEDLILETTSTALIVRPEDGSRRYELATLQPHDYPVLKSRAGGEAIALPSGLLESAIKSVQHSVSQDEARPHLSCMLLEAVGGRLRAVSTDGHRLSRYDVAWDGPSFRTSWPATMIPQALGMCSHDQISMYLVGGQAWLVVDGSSLSFPDGEADTTWHFPPWEQVIPKAIAAGVSVDRDELLSALRAVQVLNRNGPVRLEVSSGSMVLSVLSTVSGQATARVTCSGSMSPVSCNSGYLQEAVSAMPSGGVSVSSGADSYEPITVISASGCTLCVVMPVRT